MQNQNKFDDSEHWPGSAHYRDSPTTLIPGVLPIGLNGTLDDRDEVARCFGRMNSDWLQGGAPRAPDTASAGTYSEERCVHT
jgi:hypothetical protein